MGHDESDGFWTDDGFDPSEPEPIDELDYGAYDDTVVDDTVVDNTVVDNTAVDNTAVDNTVVDDLLRRQLTAAYPASAEADGALASMSPALKRARRGQQVRTTLTSMAAMVAVGVGSFVAVQAIDGQQDGNPVVAGSAASSGEDAGDSVEATTDIGTPRVAPPADGAGETDDDGAATDTDADSGASGQAGSDDGGADDGDDDPSASSTSIESTTTVSTTSTTGGSPSETTTPTSVPQATSSTTGNGDTEVETQCGTLVIAVDPPDVDLLDVVPILSGMEIDVKNSGPEKIEVGIEGRGRDCEITVEWKDGQLRTREGGES